TADLGNSRCKLRLWRPCAGRARPALLRGADFASRPGLGSALAAWAAEGPRPAHAAFCAVAAHALEDELAAALEALCADGALGRPDAGVENLCRQPESVGADRLFAARGAVALAPQGALVVSAGTALTVDAVA